MWEDESDELDWEVPDDSPGPYELCALREVALSGGNGRHAGMRLSVIRSGVDAAAAEWGVSAGLMEWHLDWMVKRLVGDVDVCGPVVRTPWTSDHAQKRDCDKESRKKRAFELWVAHMDGCGSDVAGYWRIRDESAAAGVTLSPREIRNALGIAERAGSARPMSEDETNAAFG